jgi:hypothetical protein
MSCQREAPPQTSASAIPKLRLIIPQDSKDADMEVDLLEDDQLVPVSACSLFFSYFSPSILWFHFFQGDQWLMSHDMTVPHLYEVAYHLAHKVCPCNKHNHCLLPTSQHRL